MADRRLLGAGLLGLLGLLAGSCAEPIPRRLEPDADATRGTMTEILQAVRVSLPLSLSRELFAEPGNRARIHASLGALADRANVLESHGSHRDASFGFLSRSLARDATEVLRRFEAGALEEARFLLGQLVENCVACHSRLPSPRDSDLGARLLRDVDVASLRAEERARLEVATRQFDAALATYEHIFRSREIGPVQLDLDGLLTDYLTVSIRVENDLRSPRATLDALAHRPGVPLYLEKLLRDWTDALRELSEHPPLGSPLEQAKALIAEAERRNQYPADRSGLVQDLLASSVLYRFVTQGEAAPETLAEAYFLLGVTETRISRSYWISQADFYLETSVRLAPASPVARHAYALLEEQTLFGYTGSSGLHVPERVLRHLDELRGLIEAK